MAPCRHERLGWQRISRYDKKKAVEKGFPAKAILNFFLGNEYWDGSLGTTGDPAAACCTQIAQLQNCYINVANMCGKNLHIASPTFGKVCHVSDYAKLCLNQKGE